MQDLRYLSQYAMQQLNEDVAVRQVERWLQGLRPITLDGFHSPLLMAVHAANELLGLPGIINPMLEPTRQPIVTRTLEHSIDECVHHRVANWYENGADSSFMTRKELVSYYRDKVMNIYDELGTDYALPPEVLWYAVDDPNERIKRHLLDAKTFSNSPQSQIKGVGHENDELV